MPLEHYDYIEGDEAEYGESSPCSSHDYDAVNCPKHYRTHPSGVGCVTVTEHMDFCLGNAVEDLEKAKLYIEREIQRLESVHKYYSLLMEKNVI